MVQRGPGELAMIDTHCHLWQLELAQKVWQPPTVIAKTFVPQDLSDTCTPLGVRQCVLIEAGTEPEDNQALEQFAASSNLIAGVVPFMNLLMPDLDQQLDYWETKPKFCGVRMRAEGHPDPGLMVRPAALEGFARLARRHIPFEFLVTTNHLQQVLEVYERVPDLDGVIEHLGKPDLRNGTDRREWSQLMKTLARHTKVICKLSLGSRAVDMAEIAARPGQGWPMEQIKPYVQLVLEEFGATRLMWGSDWPLSLLQSDYEGAYQTVRAALGDLDPVAEQRIFRSNGP